jgi:hypothetical protein
MAEASVRCTKKYGGNKLPGVPARHSFTIQLVARSGASAEQVERAIRAVLKYAARACGLRCTSVERSER